MPNKEDLQQFQDHLVSLAGEREFLAGQGRSPELAEPPEPGDTAAQFADLFEEGDADLPFEPEEPAEEPEDYSQKLFESVRPEEEEALSDSDAEAEFPEGFEFDEEDPFSSADQSGLPDDFIDDEPPAAEAEEPEIEDDLEDFASEPEPEPEAEPEPEVE
ncbi:MAG: periplasmic-type flagellar collar protein FlcA, partial [Spirochaeta sp.]